MKRKIPGHVRDGTPKTQGHLRDDTRKTRGYDRRTSLKTCNDRDLGFIKNVRE